MTPREHPLASLLAQIEVHSKLTPEDCQPILDLPVRLRKLDAGSFLVREGAKPASCAVLIDGYAIRQKTTGDGARQILAVCIPGDPVDLQNMFLDVADHSVQLLTQATVADIGYPAMQDLVLSHPTIGRAIIQLTLVEASILREWVVNVGRRRAQERVAHILCEFAVRLESRGLATSSGFELPMTQEQLADATGLTPVHVNRVLKALEKQGLIWRRRRVIHIPDWRRLQQVGDFTRAYLHIPGEDIVARLPRRKLPPASEPNFN
jgi:CRP-like cAMP-binding protein